MDFHSLLNKAAKNATSVNKTLETVDSEIAERKRQELKKIEADKRAKQDLALKKRALIPKRESTPEKKFVIPKKKTESSVDINGVKNFLAKQEESKKIAEKQKKIEKDNLIQLRIQSHGGKANKKIGKQFGMDPIHLQIRYGNDHTHVERLQKQQWREEEELDNLSTQYKGGVYKAIQERNKKLAEIKPGDKKEPHRVATSKSNSLYGLSSRHGNTRDHFSPPKDTKKEATKPPPVSAERKRPAAPPVDFNALMKVAADKTAGKNVDLSTLAPPPPKISKQNMDRPSSSKDVRPNYPSSSNSFKKPSALPSSSTKDQRDPQRTSNSSMSSKPKPTPSNSSSTKRPEAKPVSKTDSSSNTAKQSDKDNKGSKDAKGRFVKAPTPPPAIPSAVLGRRYLPGDVRIKQQQEMMKAAGITPSSSSSHKKGPDMESLFGSSRKPESSKVRAPDNRVSSSSNNYSSSSSAQRYSQPSSKSSSKPNVSRDKEKVREIERRKRAMEKQRYEKIRWEGMSLVERERERERQKFREMYQDEEEDEDDDEYDSGDDFIDDSGMDMDDFNRMDFEETLKMVNPKYDEKKWKIREKMISERDMETNYRNISREEARSARLGFMEDVLEAKKGKSIRFHNHVLYENFSAVPLCIDYWVTSPLLEHFDGEPFVFSSKKIATLLGIDTSEIVAKASLDETWYSFKIDENKLTSIETLSEVLKELVVAVDPTPVQETETVLFPMGLAGSFDVLLTQREGLLDVRIYNLFGAECGRMQGISSRRTERVSNLVRGISSTRSSSSEFDDSPDVQLDPAVASIIISTLQEMNFDTSTLFPTESFVSYGLDSLELVELEQRLSHKLGVQLPVATLDRDTTMETLTNFVRDLIPTTQEREVDEFAGIPTSQPSKWQKRILLVDSLEPDRKAQFSETVSFNIQNREELKRDRLQEAVSTLIAINPNLRAFYSYDVKLFLSGTESYLLPSSETTLEFLEKGLDLKKSLPISWNLAEDALSLVFHHVTVDGFSLQLLLSQFKKILTGTELQIDQASFEQNDSDEEGEFSPSQPTDKFPSDFPPSSEHSKKAKTLRKTFDLTKLMRQLRTNFRCTDYEIFCSSFSLMMRRRCATEMMSIGTAVSVRKEKQMSTVDCLVSVLPVTLNVNGNHTIKEHFGRVAEQLNEVQRNVDSLSTGPVQILLVMDKVGSFEIPGFEMIQTTPAVCKYDQTWYFRKAASRYEIVIEYCSELFLDETMHSMMNDLLRTIRRLSQSSPHTVIQNIDFTNNHLSREKGRVDYPSTAVSNMFQTRDYSSMNWTFGSEVRPQSDIQYTSTVLSRLWEQKYIQHYGDIPAADRQIVLFLPRSMFLGNAVLACWNLGMSIVPISRDWPNQRILDLVTRLHNSLVVTDDSKLTKHLEDTKVLVLNPTVGYSTVSRKLWNRMSKASLGYITCTSGSTGVSKAVCSSIRGLSNLAMNYTRQFFLSSNSRMYQIVNYAFDIFFADLCKSLANGSCLVFAKESLPDWNELSSCSNAYIMPAILSSLPNDTIRKISTLETLQFGGERIHPAALDRLLNTGVSLFQEFGLTEQCVYSSVLRLKKAQNSSFLGQPYENLTLVVKDSFGNVVDYNGTLGELFVDGFTARGYHGMVERNKERFVNGQFATRDQVVSYEKCLKFIGRMDLQVKILGRRIELSEIEAVLCKLSGVEGAVTMVSAERILAFVKTTIKPGELKQFALQHLPEYMVPEEIILVENFPLNANGKIDKTKLFIPSAIEPTFKIQPPSTQQEIIICDAMIRILGEPIGANECFFKKGGNSVKAMLVMQVMKERGLHIEVKDFFKARTAEEIARNLSQEEEDDTTVEETKIAKPQEVLYPLSHVQRRLWFVQKLQSDSDAYMYKLKIDFNPEIAEDRISAAMDEIIKHNPYLRAVIIENDGVPFWRITADQSPLLIYSVINSQLRMSLNHLLLDGRSLAILAEQLEKVFSENELEIVNPLLPRGEETDSSYWSQLLDSFETKAFPPRSAPSFSFTGQVGRVKVLVPAGLIERVCSKLGTTERFPVLLLAVVGTMRRVFDEDDIVIGTTVANRTLYDYGTVGMFANTLPLRFSGKMTIGKVEAQLHNLLLHQNAGLDTIQKLTDMRELIRCVVNYQNISLNNYTFSFGRITIEEHRHAQFPISWIFSDQKKGIDLTLEYDRSLFADHEPRNFSRWFLKFLAQMFRQRSHVLAENKVDVPKATVPSIFYEQTRRTPQSGRFESLEEKLTYEESLGRSLTLSHCIEDCIIRTSGRPPRADDIVAISLEESVSLQLTISSVLLLGCTYTVIPLSFPQEKKEQLLDESRPILVIHDENITFPSWTSFSLTQATRNRRKFILRSHPRDLMYAMFTSGSTGKPKGVPIAYQGAVNMLVHATKLYHIRSEGRILQFTKSHFDASISNIFGSLVNGITLCLLDKDKEAVDAVSSLLPLSVVHMTPMVLDYLWKEPTLQSGIETWSIGGESPSSFSVNGLLFQGQRIVQLYGPTEGTCYQTASVLTLNNPVNCVGTVVYNLPFGLCSWGKEKSLQEDVGQFFCGGEQLSRGYLNDVEKTTLSFVPQLIQSEDDLVLDRNSKVYLSGDRLRRNSQGNLYFLGRKDQQVKVSGSRVEIGEIESAIGRLEGVLSVAVVLQKDQFKKNHLVAFYCGKERDFIFDLATKLAPHMIPLKFVNLDRMPLTSNGKIDKKLLAIRKDVMQKEIAPIRATAIEEKVLSVYRLVLNNEQVQLDDNFFSNGGHSLLAVKLVHHLEKTFDITLPLATVFTEPSPRKMSKFVESSKKVGKEEHRAVSLRPSVLQLPLLRLFRNLSFQNIYTNTVKLRMLKSVSKEKLQKVFKELMRAHLILRTIYRRKAKELTAWTAENVPWNIIRASPEDGLDVFKSFPISIEIEDQSLILKTSHVAVDGHSMKILVQDIEKLLDGKELKGSDKVAEFHQYVQVHFQEHKLLSLEYWRTVLENFSNNPIATDYPNQMPQDYRSVSIKRRISNFSKNIQNLARTNNTSPFSVLIYLVSRAMNGILKRAYSSRMMAFPMNMRSSEHEETVTMGVNTGLVHLTGNENISVVGAKLSESLAHPVLLTDLATVLPNVNKFYEVMVTFDDYSTYKNKYFEVVREPEKYSKCEISIFAGPKSDEIVVDYVSSLFKHETIEALLNDMQLNLRTIIDPEDQFDSFLLTQPQKQMFMASLTGQLRILPFLLRKPSGLSTERLQEIVLLLTQKHEVLRTVFFVSDNGEPRQKVLSLTESYRLIYRDKYKKDSPPKSILLDENVLEVILDKDLLVLWLHHLVTDAWSTRILERDLEELLRIGTKEVHPLKQSIGFNLDRKKTSISNAVLMSVSKADLLFQQVSEKTTFHAKSFTVSKKSSFDFFSRLVLALRNFFKPSTSMNIGLPFANRTSKTSKLVGYFLNNLVINVSKDDTMDDISQKRKQAVIENIPYMELLSAVRDFTRKEEALFQVYINQRYDLESSQPDDKELMSLLPLNCEFALEIDIDSYDQEEKVTVRGQANFISEQIYNKLFDYLKDSLIGVILQQSSLETVLDIVGKLLRKEVKPEDNFFTLGGNSLQAVELAEELEDALETEIEMEIIYAASSLQDIAHKFDGERSELDPKEEPTPARPKNEQIVIEGRTSDVPHYSFSRVLNHLTTSNHPMFVFSDHSTVLYSKVVSSVKKGAYYLKQAYLKLTGRPIRADDILPVIGEKSLETWVDCLTVQCCGAAYLPIRLSEPIHRIREVLGRTKSVCYIGANVHLDLPKLDIHANSRSTDFVLNNGSDLAYVISTSGTTGAPKAVAVQHKGVLNMAMSSVQDLRLTSRDVLNQFTNFSFDNSVLELFSAIAASAELFLDCSPFTPRRFVRQIRTHKLTHCLLFPALVNQFKQDTFESLKYLKYWVTGAEKLSPDLFSRAIGIGLNIVQNYGPTETTCYALTRHMKKGDHSANLGKPIQNTSVWIEGERLFVSGHGIMRGYLNRTDSFVKKKTGIWYATGDIIEANEEKNVLFIGREDSQVKIRGHRVELGEIEERIIELSGVSQCKARWKDRTLTVYCVTELDEAAVRKHCEKILPLHMRPNEVRILEELPLTENSKVDFRRLEKSPRLVAVVEEFLETSVDPKKSLLEVGGTTLVAIHISKKLKQNFSVETLLTKPLETVLPEEYKSTRVSQAWRRVLGDGNFDDKSHFLLSGGTSLHVLKLRQELLKLGMDVSVQQLMNNLELGQMMQLDQPRAVSVLFECNTPKRTVILLHPLYGGAAAYLHLVPLLEEEQTRIVAIEHPNTFGFNTDRLPFFESIDSLAVAYSQQLEEYLCGDVILCGVSIGGTLAAEIARNLLRMPKAVLVVDTLATPNLSKYSFENHRKQLLSDISFVNSAVLANSWDLLNMLNRHQWQIFDFPITLLSVDGTDLGWKRFCTQLTIFPINSSHSALLLHPAVDEIAKRIRSFY